MVQDLVKSRVYFSLICDLRTWSWFVGSTCWCHWKAVFFDCGSSCPSKQFFFQNRKYTSWVPVSILHKSIAGRYRPVRVADGPIMARCIFIKNASRGGPKIYKKYTPIFIISYTLIFGLLSVLRFHDNLYRFFLLRNVSLHVAHMIEEYFLGFKNTYKYLIGK